MRSNDEEWDDESTTAITLWDRRDMAREWWRANVTNRGGGTGSGLHSSPGINVTVKWRRAYLLLLGATVGTAAVVLTSIGISVMMGMLDLAHSISAYGAWALLGIIALARIARAQGYRSTHGKWWVPNMQRTHIHNGTCCQGSGRHQKNDD